jgi:hypothetical protein
MRCNTTPSVFKSRRGGKINRSTGEAIKNRRGEQYELYHRTPSVFKSGKGWKNK